MKQLDQSVIIGIFGLIGLFIGLFVKNIMVWTFVGIAVGYVVTFWIPYFKKQSQLKKKNRVEETFLVCPSHCTVRTEPYTALHL